jgi:hypothetical protein
MPGLFYWPLLPFQLAANAYLLLRAFSVGIGSAFWRAMKDGYGGLPRRAAQREAIQRARKASLGDLARAFTWSPIKVSRREANLRPIAASGSAGRR